jgi:hypothetical protein
MCTTGATDAQAGCEGAEWVRDLFLRQLAEAGKKPKDRKTSSPAADGLDFPL